MYWYFLSSIITLAYLYGSSFIWCILLALPNFYAARYGGKYTPYFAWASNVILLFLIEWFYATFKFSILLPPFAFLDNYGGLIRFDEIL